MDLSMFPHLPIEVPVRRLPMWRLPMWLLPMWRLPVWRLPVWRLPVWRLPVWRLSAWRVWVRLGIGPARYSQFVFKSRMPQGVIADPCGPV